VANFVQNTCFGAKLLVNLAAGNRLQFFCRQKCCILCRNNAVFAVKEEVLWQFARHCSMFFVFHSCVIVESPAPFVLSYSVFYFIFSVFFVSGPCAGLSWPSRKLLSAR